MRKSDIVFNGEELGIQFNYNSCGSRWIKRIVKNNTVSYRGYTYRVELQNGNYYKAVKNLTLG